MAITTVTTSLPGGAPPPPILFPEAPLVHPPAHFVGRFGACARNGAECTPRELRGPILRPFSGPR
eukprot:13455341-Alexandrium_andersonii.AAC.1